MHGFTAAHRKLPFHTWLKVRNLTNQQEVVVRINDRGPFVKGRIIDLSRRAAQEIQMIGPGTAKVRITVIKPPKRPPSIAGN
jgi:rare lipoprotein A